MLLPITSVYKTQVSFFQKTKYPDDTLLSLTKKKEKQNRDLRLIHNKIDGWKNNWAKYYSTNIHEINNED